MFFLTCSSCLWPSGLNFPLCSVYLWYSELVLHSPAGVYHARFVPLPFCLYPVFCAPYGGRCLGCGCGLGWFCWGCPGAGLGRVAVCALLSVPFGGFLWCGSCMPVLRRAAVSYVVCARYRVCVWYGYPCVCVLGLVVGVLVYMLCTVFSMSAF